MSMSVKANKAIQSLRYVFDTLSVSYFNKAGDWRKTASVSRHHCNVGNSWKNVFISQKQEAEVVELIQNNPFLSTSYIADGMRLLELLILTKASYKTVLIVSRAYAQYISPVRRQDTCFVRLACHTVGTKPDVISVLRNNFPNEDYGFKLITKQLKVPKRGRNRLDQRYPNYLNIYLFCENLPRNLWNRRLEDILALINEGILLFLCISASESSQPNRHFCGEPSATCQLSRKILRFLDDIHQNDDTRIRKVPPATTESCRFVVPKCLNKYYYSPCSDDLHFLPYWKIGWKVIEAYGNQLSTRKLEIVCDNPCLARRLASIAKPHINDLKLTVKTKHHLGYVLGDLISNNNNLKSLSTNVRIESYDKVRFYDTLKMNTSLQHIEIPNLIVDYEDTVQLIEILQRHNENLTSVDCGVFKPFSRGTVGPHNQIWSLLVRNQYQRPKGKWDPSKNMDDFVCLVEASMNANKKNHALTLQVVYNLLCDNPALWCPIQKN